MHARELGGDGDREDRRIFVDLVVPASVLTSSLVLILVTRSGDVRGGRTNPREIVLPSSASPDSAT